MTEFNELKGCLYQGFSVNPDGYFLTINTNKGDFVFKAEGDCCANAYIAEYPDTEENSACKNSIIEWFEGDGVTSTNDDESYGETVDTEFYTLQTDTNFIRFTLRTEHNGYYSGWLELVSKP